MIVSHPASEDPRLAFFRHFGVDRTEDDQTVTRILAAYGVPLSGIVVSVTDGVGTLPELRAVARFLRRKGLQSVILVTDSSILAGPPSICARWVATDFELPRGDRASPSIGGHGGGVRSRLKQGCMSILGSGHFCGTG